MKKLILLLFLIATTIGSAQIVTIPDANFKAELIADGVDTSGDGEIQVTEAEAVTLLSLNNPGITDLDGIQSFINLQSFSVAGTGITSLDLTANVNITTVLLQQTLSLASIDLTNCQLLEDLRFYSTALTTIDLNFNPLLEYLNFIGNNNLETVFIKNGADESTNVDPGSWSENWGFGNNSNLLYVCADEFQVFEIQQFAGTNYPVNSFCTFSPGGEVNTITGVSQFDDEGNGCDSGDASIPYTSFNIDFDGMATDVIAYSNNQGIYNVYAGQIGTYTLQPNPENPTYFTISPSPADIVIPVIDNSIITQDFCAEADGIHADLEVVITPIMPARPGFEAVYSLVYKNKGNQTLSGDVTFAYDEAVLDFVASSTPPDAQTSGFLTYNFADLQPYQNESIEITLQVNAPTDTPPVNIDDILVFDAVINPITGDETPNDNTFVLDQVVVGSFDPNNIICIQGEEVPTTFIGEYLHYVINFENTGTAAAENVVVTMEIDPTDFDPNTLQILNVSHEMQLVIINNRAEFHFQSINLDTGGHGNILLKMKTNSDLTTTDEVGAAANIYFDFNFPIETNEALTSFRVLGVNTFDASQLVLYPNPATDKVTLQSPMVIQSVAIYDLQGRKIEAVTTNDLNTEVTISALTSGIYLFSIETEFGTVIKKVQKQ